MSDQPHDQDEPFSDETEPLADSFDTENTDDQAIEALPEEVAPDEPTENEAEAVAEIIAEEGEEVAESAPAPEGVGFDATATDEFSINLALASVATLSDALAQQEAEREAEAQRELAEQQEAEQLAAERALPFPAPPFAPVQRGTIGSFVPALVLMLLGGWLTFTLSTTGQPPDAGLLAGVVLAGVAVILLARWFSTGRWSRGLLFAGVTLLLIGAVLAGMALALGVAGYPLLLAALGVALLLTALLGRPRDGRLIAPALLLIVGGAAGTAVTLGLLPASVTILLATWWMIPVAVLGIIVLAALLGRRGRSQ